MSDNFHHWAMLMVVAESVGATDRVEFLRRYETDPLIHALTDRLIQVNPATPLCGDPKDNDTDA